MELKDWTPVKNGDGSIRAIFADKFAADAWCDETGFGFTVCPRVTLTLPDAPRNADVVARELAKEYLYCGHHGNKCPCSWCEKLAKLGAEYRLAINSASPATFAPQPAPPKRYRIESSGDAVHLYIPMRDGAGEWVLRTDRNAHVGEIAPKIAADLRAAEGGGR